MSTIYFEYAKKIHLSKDQPELCNVMEQVERILLETYGIEVEFDEIFRDTGYKISEVDSQLSTLFLLAGSRWDYLDELDA